MSLREGVISVVYYFPPISLLTFFSFIFNIILDSCLPALFEKHDGKVEEGREGGEEEWQMRKDLQAEMIST